MPSCRTRTGRRVLATPQATSVRRTARLARSRFLRSLLLLGFALLWQGSAHADALDSSVQRRLHETVFEVVLGKPMDDPLTYEKELPLDLLPYNERTSKYRAIGTAFVIEANRFVTAAHVIADGTASQFGPLAIRDASGAIFLVDKITKYSVEEDYAEFTVQGAPRVKPLETEPHPELNQPVFAVGNALGEGIVIRDGLYTSNTPEERSGRWQWIRFSAAASPGNSGGPLVDRKGRVIGVILRKSPSENLNMAVAITQVQHGSMESAAIDGRYSYVFPPMLTPEPAEINEKVPLPKAIADFYTSVAAVTDGALLRVQARYLADHAAMVFPHGSESESLLHELFIAPFPRAIVQRPDKSWGLAEAAPQRAQLESNGFIESAVHKSIIYLRLRPPDDVPPARIYGNSKLFMDLVLKALLIRRPVGTDAVRITSLGPAHDDEVYKDGYGRTWQLRVWRLPYNDSVLLTLGLPTPQGYVALAKECPTLLQGPRTQELKTLAGFTYISLEGTLKQWREYLAQPLVPDAVRALDIGYDYGKDFHFRSPRLTLTVPNGTLKINPDGVLILKTTYLPQRDGAVWDVGGIFLSDTEQRGNWVDVLRRSRPPASLPATFAQYWHTVETGAHPYTAASYAINGSTRIETVAKGNKDATGENAIAYTIALNDEGTLDQATMKRKLDAVVNGILVLEK